MFLPIGRNQIIKKMETQNYSYRNKKIIVTDFLIKKVKTIIIKNYDLINYENKYANYRYKSIKEIFERYNIKLTTQNITEIIKRLKLTPTNKKIYDELKTRRGYYFDKFFSLLLYNDRYNFMDEEFLNMVHMDWKDGYDINPFFVNMINIEWIKKSGWLGDRDKLILKQIKEKKVKKILDNNLKYYYGYNMEKYSIRCEYCNKYLFFKSGKLI